jgi:hypothetical protein
LIKNLTIWGLRNCFFIDFSSTVFAAKMRDWGTTPL